LVENQTAGNMFH